jgi:hypothetical protein
MALLKTFSKTPTLWYCALAASSGIVKAVPLRLMGPISVFKFLVCGRRMGRR